MVVYFVGIGGIVKLDNHCLNFLFIMELKFSLIINRVFWSVTIHVTDAHKILFLNILKFIL